jgi:hypothetical protein
MSAVVDFVGDVFEGAVDIVEDTFETVGDVVEDTFDAVGDAIESVGDTLGDVVEGALDDPIGTIATVATAVYAPYMLPAVSAGRTLANGGDLGDAMKSAAISYVAQGVGDYVGDQLGTAVTYGTDVGSQQTAMLAAQSGDMLGGTFGGTVGNAAAAAASGATAAALSGGDVGQAAINALGTYGLRLGVDYTLDAAGNAVNAAGEVLADSSGDVNTDAVEVGDDFAPEVGVNIDAFGREIGDQNPYASTDYGTTESPEFRGDYSLVPSTKTPAGFEDTDLGTGLEAPTIPESAADDYSLTPTGTEFAGRGLQMPSSPDLESMGGAQGITADVEGGTVGEMGFTSDSAVPVLGDPDSLINDPAYLGTDVIKTTMSEPTPELDRLLQKGGKYLKNQFTRELSKDIFGNSGGDVRQRFSPNLTSLGGVGGQSIYDMLAGLEFDPGFSDDVEAGTTAAPMSTEGLYDPLSGASWAPQTKIGGLGFAGKFINQEDDTYYVNKEQDTRARRAEEMRNQPWLTDEDRQRLLEQGDQDRGMFYNYDQVDYRTNPWETPTTFAAAGGLIGHNPEFFSEGGASLGNRYVKGEGDGTSDSVPAMLASGEFVIPADVVSGLGNGDNDAGAQVLDEFMAAIRKHKRGASPDQLPPDSKGPLSYLSEALTKSNGKRS